MSRNFGLGSRDMGTAGQYALNNAAQSGGVSFSTAATNGDRWQSFADWAKEEGVKKMEAFINESLTREIAEFAQDKAAVVETKVRLVAGAKKKLAEIIFEEFSDIGHSLKTIENRL